MQPPDARSHEYPAGQQCLESEQHTALTSGQQPHSPDGSLQQVVPEAQLLLSSHLTSVTASGSLSALTLVNQGTTWRPLEQEER